MSLSVIRAFGLPDVFPEEALEEARQAAAILTNRSCWAGKISRPT